jgi:hypothetical protein
MQLPDRNQFEDSRLPLSFAQGPIPEGNLPWIEQEPMVETAQMDGESDVLSQYDQNCGQHDHDPSCASGALRALPPMWLSTKLMYAGRG